MDTAWHVGGVTQVRETTPACIAWRNETKIGLLRNVVRARVTTSNDKGAGDSDRAGDRADDGDSDGDKERDRDIAADGVSNERVPLNGRG